MSDIEQRLDERYARSFGRIAGYLPKNRGSVDAFQRNLMQSATVEGEIHSPSVAALARLIETVGVVRMYVTQMIDQEIQRTRITLRTFGPCWLRWIGSSAQPHTMTGIRPSRMRFPCPVCLRT